MDISENRCSHIRNTSAEEMHHCIRAYLARLRKLSLLGCNPSETLTSVCQSTWRQIPASNLNIRSREQLKYRGKTSTFSVSYYVFACKVKSRIPDIPLYST